jgi:cytochrome b6-f complex iron-sulfur subunit
MEKTSQSRRTFIKSLALLAGFMALLWKYLTPAVVRQQHALVRIDRKELPAEGALVYREAKVALFNLGGELYALSLVCTHLGCTLNLTDQGLSCPCHGSLFDMKGNVIEGPAERSLPKLRVTENAGVIEVVEL